MKQLTSLLIDSIPTIITGIIGGFLWLFEKKQRKIDRLKSEAELSELRANVKGADADATQKVIDLYQEALDDLKNRHDERLAEIKSQYDNSIGELKKYFERQMADMRTEFEGKIKKLNTNMEYWKTKYKNLKQAFDNVRG